MKVFKVKDNIDIVCRSENTRYGFRHLATLLINGREIENAKCCYYNRTWESYEFQSVLYEVVNKAFKNNVLSEEDKNFCNEFIKEGREAHEEVRSELRTISMVAKIGEAFCSDQKGQNDWKARMLKAGLGNRGLDMPEDWNSLDEDEKQKRLDGVIKELSV